MDLPDHCWHDTGRVAESYPEQYEQKCCCCGEDRWIRRRAVLPDGRVVDLDFTEKERIHEQPLPPGTVACQNAPRSVE